VNDTGELDELREWLAERYAPSVRTAYLILGNRADAEDAVQEAFLRAWRFRESVSSRTNAAAWLYRVVVNTCNSMLRKEIPHRARRRSLEEIDLFERTSSAGERAANSDIMRALSDLPTHLRVVVVLRYYADLSEREIAVAIGRPPGTVKSRLHEARSRLALHPALRTETEVSPDEESS
jgi:RNA polymerase sigma-70 factor (ECF subfamily)